MKYHIALNLHKTVNQIVVPDFNQIILLDQIISTSRQIHFQVQKKCNSKIGMNITANKFYHINN